MECTRTFGCFVFCLVVSTGFSSPRVQPDKKLVVFSIIMIVRQLEHSVDFEELERSRYEYKGA